MKRKVLSLDLKKLIIGFILAILCFVTTMILYEADSDVTLRFEALNLTEGTNADGEPTYTWGDPITEANVGDIIAYRVKLDNPNQKEINTLLFRIDYDDTKLEFISEEVLTTAISPAGGGGATEPGVPMIGYQFSKVNGTIKSAPTLLMLKFKVKDGALGDCAAYIQKDDPDVLQVFKADSDGKVETSYTVDTVSSSVKVLVPFEPSSLTVPSTMDINLSKGETSKALNITYNPTTDAPNLTCTSSNESKVTANVQDGKCVITGVAGGTATVTVNIFGVTKTVAVNVIREATGIKIKSNGTVITETTVERRAGTTLNLTAEVEPSDATNAGTLTWTSDNENVATVNNGVVTPIAEGTANIRVSNGSVGSSVTVTVVVPIDSASIKDKADFELYYNNTNNTKTLEKVVEPADAAKGAVWVSSDNGIATVDQNGLVKAISKGETTISLVTGNTTWESVKVTVKAAVTGLDLNVTENDTITLVPNGTQEITATVLPSDADNKVVTWTSNDPSVATVDNTGKITAIAIGETTVTANIESFTKTVKVKVVEAVTDITANPANVTLDLNTANTTTIGYIVNNNASSNEKENYTISWASSDTDIATVSNQGVVTATGRKLGTVTITGSVETSITNRVFTITSTVSVVAPITGITLNKTNFTITGKNTTETLVATITPKLYSGDGTITWTSSNPSALSVDTNGKLTALLPADSVVITATTANGKTATSTVKVVIPTESVEITKDSEVIEMRLDGSNTVTKQLVWTITPTPNSDTATWKSSDTSVVTVSNTGLLTAVGKGEATITLTSGSKSDTVKVKVILPITDFNLKSDANIEVKRRIGASLIEYEILPKESNEDKTVTWTSSDENIAKVDENGRVTGVNGGTAVITGKLKNNMTITVNVTIIVVPIDSLEMEKEEVTILKGRFNAKVLGLHIGPDDTTESDKIVWTSTDETVATVDSEGIVTGLKAGTTTITATYTKADGTKLETSAEIEIKEIPLESISIVNTPTKLEIGKTSQINVALNPIDTTDAEDLVFTYKSSDEAIATVDEFGVITAKGVGLVKITVTAKDGIEATLELNVVAETNPKTGDSIIYSCVLLILSSLAGISLIVLKAKRK